MRSKLNDSKGLVASDVGIRLRGVTRSFAAPAGAFHALADLDLEIGSGQSVAVVGASGSGKSTLLHLIAGIDRPSSGQVWVAGHALHELGEEALTAFRGRHVGIVFQFFQLLPTLTALENVVVAMDFVGVIPTRQRRERGLELLERFGVVDQADKLPATLSGGQQQRVAIARALANDPPLVVADEPTGNLDSGTADQVLTLLVGLAELGKTVIIVTHERDLKQHLRRVVELADGRVIADRVAASALDAAREARCTA